jgi:hypothetical protein
MIHPEQTPKKPTAATGIFALLWNPLGFGGSGAPKTPLRLFLSILIPILGTLAFTAVPALAAAPEKPELTVKPIWATTATFNGTLNPHASTGEPGTYKYLYKQGPSCVGGIENGGIVGGEPGEVLPVEVVKGLTASSEYTVCLSFTSTATSETSEAAVTFTTAAAAPPEAPEVTAVSERRAESATLNGVVNPLKEGEPGHYRFVYRQNPTECTGAGAVETAEEEAPGSSPQGVSVGISGLMPGKSYTFCVKAFNALGTGTLSAPEHFETAIPPETPTKEAFEKVTATAATVKAELNHLKAGEKGSLEVLYKVSPLSAAPTAECEENTISVPATGAQEEQVSAKLEGLQPNAKYTFCLRAKNEAGEESALSTAKTFTTLPAPATIDSLSVSHVKSSEATLEGAVNPNNQLIECHFQYVDEEEFLNTGFTKAAEVACSPEQLKGYSEQTVSPTRTEDVEGNIVTVPAPITGLAQGTEYHYRILTKNGKGEEGIEAKTFRTTDEPEKQAATEVTATTATLNGVLDPHNAFEAGTYEFLYKQSEGECTGGSVTPAGSATGASAQAVSAKIAGLQPGATYAFCLLQRNGAGEEVAISSPETFPTPPAAPTIVGEFTTGVEGANATLNAQIDPDGLTTTYHFEYDTTPYTSSAQHGTSLTEEGENTEVNIGAGTSAVSVEVKLKGLEPGRTYHYRVVATNSLSPTGGALGPDATFTTPGGQTTNSKECPNEQRRVEQPYGLKLPDCRAYEMVSPLETIGNDGTDSFIPAGQVRASEDKEKEAEGEEATPAITYRSYGSFGDPVAADYESQVLSRRNVQKGRWETRSIDAPVEHDTQGEVSFSYTGVFFTPGLTQGLTSTAAAGLSSEVPEGLKELYLADLTDGPGPYQLVSQLPPSEEIYGTPYQEPPANVFPLGASSDLTHVVFATENGGGAIGPLREWVAGRVVFVGVSNKEGEVWTGAEVGNNPSLDKNVRLEDGDANLWRAVSEDGSRVIFNYSGELYARVNVEQPQSPMKDLGQPGEECEDPADACTVKLSAGTARYVGASTNDSKVFYIENGNLYEYKLPIGSVKGQARALTSGGEVQGVSQISEDGSYVYFVAGEALKNEHGETLKNISGVEPSPGADNLYVSHQGGAEPVKFIATLSANDGSDWEVLNGGQWEGGPGSDSAVLAPGVAGGAHLAFTSGESLTGYDNRDAVSGGLDSEVFLYDTETGVLTCASCDPSGARPVGSAGLATAHYFGNRGASNYRPRDLLADGSLFFDSSDALVPHASDGRQNVYEYEDGQIYPISNVAGGQESFFLDASPDGQDVFFATADQLLPEDTGDNVVVWDAREDGGFPVNVSAPPCTTGEACRVAPNPEPSIYGAGPSETFSGPGNFSPRPAVVKPAVKPKTLTRAQKLAAALKVCKKDKKKSKRQSCEKKARAKYGPAKKKAKKSAHTNRRAGR